MRDTFILSTEDAELIDELEDLQAGVLLKAIMAYQLGCDLPEMDKETKLVFTVIRKRLERFNDAYETKCKRRSEAGKKGGRPRKEASEDEKANDNFALEEKAKKPIAFLGLSEKAKKAYPEPEPEPEPDNNKTILSSGGSTVHEAKPEMNVPEAAGIIISHLNEKTGGHYQATSKETVELIRRRMKAGFKVNDFIIVIDKKVKEWKGTDMEQYLRPVTLFSTKFENYLNAPEQRARAKPKGHNFQGRDQDFNAVFSSIIEAQ